MTFTMTHRDGRMDSEPRLDDLDALATELDLVDAEHPDIAVEHESGWSLSIAPSGRATLENVDSLESPPITGVMDRSRVVSAMRAVAEGDIDRVVRILDGPTGQTTIEDAFIRRGS